MPDPKLEITPSSGLSTVAFKAEEVQLLVQVLERFQAGNKEMVVLKHGIMGKLLPHLVDESPSPKR